MNKVSVLITLLSVCLFYACQKSEGITGIEFDSDSKEMIVGESGKINVFLSPSDANSGLLEWSSSDPSVAEVVSGVVTALAPGECRITAAYGNVSDYCNITVSEPYRDPAVGDYYYSDGTYSNRLYSDKNVIGIVFWTGNPAEHDKTLQKEHPECTHGLVMALNGFEAGPWQMMEDREEYKLEYPAYQGTVSLWAEANIPEYMSIFTNTALEDNLNKKVGYNNTKVLELFNASADNAEWPLQIVKRLESYRDQVPAPESSSGWYIPSPKELSLYAMGNYEDNIDTVNSETNHNEQGKLLNEIMAGVPGANPLPVGGFQVVHWSSSEVVTYNGIGRIVGTCSIDYGCAGSDLPDREHPYSRMILAF